MTLAKTENIKLPAFSDNLALEVKAISEDYTNGALAQEFSLLRFARLVIEDKYRGQKITNELEGGEIAFPTGEDLIRYVCRLTNISRPTFYNRLQGYRRLVKGIGQSYEQAFKVTLRAPGAYKQLTAVATFAEDGTIQKVDVEKARGLPSKDPEYVAKLAELSEEQTTPLVRAALGELVQDVSELSRGDAHSMIERRLAKNSIRFFHRNGDGILVAECTERSIDKDGVVYDSPPFTVEWTPDCKQIPDWVLEKLYDRLNASEDKDVK